jgi:hypothetical protein
MRSAALVALSALAVSFVGIDAAASSPIMVFSSNIVDRAHAVVPETIKAGDFAAVFDDLAGATEGSVIQQILSKGRAAPEMVVSFLDHTVRLYDFYLLHDQCFGVYLFLCNFFKNVLRP